MEALLGRHWHHMPTEEILDLLGVGLERGLGALEVASRQERFGLNVITPARRKGPVLRFLLQFHQALVYILLAAGVITGLIAEWSDATAIFSVVFVNAVIGFIQEHRAASAIEALARTMAATTTVIRSGEPSRIPSSELVPGDIVMLQSGDRVPADLRLIQVRELRVDESALTGESIPVEKLSVVLDHDAVLADRRNMAYASTLATYGQALGVVVATGDRTEMGRISRMISEAVVLETPLTQKIAYFSRILLFAILALGGATFAAGLAYGEPVIDTFMAAVALTVGSIPEGLPAAVTIILAVGVSRMAKRRAIIRRLPAVETLGSTNVICSDKTGTLTENQMTVRQIYSAQDLYHVTGSGYDPAGAITREDEAVVDAPLALIECLRNGLLTNDSKLANEDGLWKAEGDPTEVALIVAAEKMELTSKIQRELFPRLDTIPFESEHQYMATLHASATDGGRVIYMKGALEAVLPRCSSALDATGALVSFDPKTVRSIAERMAGAGLRVLAFARHEMESEASTISHEDVQSGLTFLGLQGMIDPPRAEAIEAVSACRRAGIRVKMMTGDHGLTASAIARQVGIIETSEHSPAAHLFTTGKEMLGLSDEQLLSVAERTNVFARVAPEQKLRLVRALQARGNVVAMTGDGVNDAPALKRADIGIAMGITGTEVAKEAADMVLTDDNFASIEAAVEEGRCVFDNLLKFIVWALPTNLGQGLVILTAVLAGVPLPILPVQSLWINMTTAGSLGLMLAFEPKEPGIMARPPRDARVSILPIRFWIRIVLVGIVLMFSSFGLFEWEQLSEATDAQARTVAVNVFAAISALYLFSCRSLERSFRKIGVLTNKWVILGVSIMAVLQLAFTYVPFMNSLFHTTPIGYESWLRIAVVSLVAGILIGFEKYLWIRRSVLRIKDATEPLIICV